MEKHMENIGQFVNEKDKKFFDVESSKTALTSTSAEHIASKAKEIAKSYVEAINKTKFVSTFSTIGESGKEVCTVAATENLEDLKEKIKSVPKFYALIAWLREGIKAKTRICENIEGISFESWFSKCHAGEELPHQEEVEEELTKSEAYKTLTADDLAKYYIAESTASFIGECIHPDGAVAKARNESYKVDENCGAIRDVAGNIVVDVYKKPHSAEDIDNLFFDLNGLQRTAQAAVNKVKHDLESLVNKSHAEYLQNYNKAYQEYNNKINALRQEFRLWKANAMIEANNLRITVPNSLQDMHKMVNNW